MDTRERLGCCSRYRGPIAVLHTDIRALVAAARDEVWTWQLLAFDALATRMMAIEGTSWEVDRNTLCVGGTIAAEADVPAHHLAWAVG